MRIDRQMISEAGEAVWVDNLKGAGLGGGGGKDASSATEGAGVGVFRKAKGSTGGVSSVFACGSGLGGGPPSRRMGNSVLSDLSSTSEAEALLKGLEKESREGMYDAVERRRGGDERSLLGLGTLVGVLGREGGTLVELVGGEGMLKVGGVKVGGW